MRGDRVPYDIVASLASCGRIGVISASIGAESSSSSGTIMIATGGDEGAGVGSMGEIGERVPDGDISSQDLHRY
jgi:hypothetical protein